MNLSIATLAYLFLQLSPFIIVSYFSLSSVFNRDIKGIIFLFGLIFNLTLFYGIMSLIKPFWTDLKIEGVFQLFDTNLPCASFDSGFNKILEMPVNTSILSFTFWYIMFTLIELDMKEIGVKHGMDPDMANRKWRANFPTPFIHNNWPVISMLIILLVANIGFNFVIDPTQDKTACFTLFQHIVTLAISGCLGIAWSAFIRSTKTPELQYFSKYKNNENCKKASSKEFKCKIYKNGQEVGSTSGDNIFTIQS
jgi:hypothetical protein